MSLPEVPKGPLLGGEEREGEGGLLPVLSPSTGEVVAEVGTASAAQVREAVEEAAAAHEEGRWRRLPVLERQRVLMAVAALLRAHDKDLAALIATEMGMPEGAARFIEVPFAAATFEYYAALVPTTAGETLPVDVPGAPPEYLAYTLREPVGVCGLITPWNFPLLLPAWKLAPALAAGCTAVLKPAPEAPLTALFLGRLLQEAGVPDGVVHVLPGGDRVGEELVRDPKVAKVAVTGETETGRRVLAAAAPGIKRVSLELGGKSPSIVFPDVDLDQAVSQCLFGIYFNAGQVCQAGSRILVHESVYEEFLERFVARARALRVGDARDPAVDVGPLVREDRLERVDGYVQGARADGARVLLGGRRLPGRGYFYAPTVVADVHPEMALFQEEVFGPVAAVLPFRDEQEAVRLANATAYGLAAAVFTRDVRRALRMARDVRAGTVWINTVQILSPTAPFGGMGSSGLGRELGRQGLEAYLETKTVIVDLNDEPMTYF